MLSNREKRKIKNYGKKKAGLSYMKKIVLAFDDGRRDQYSNAIRIMNKYGIKGTIYITTGFVDGTIGDREKLFPSSGGEAMTIEQVRKCIELGYEIGAHSNLHTNAVDDIKESLKKLEEWTSDILPINYKFGFASPSSDIYKDNLEEIKEIWKDVKYIRTSVQIRRNGIWYTMLYIINKLLKSNMLFYILFKNYYSTVEEDIIPSIPVKSDTSIRNLKSFIDRMDDEKICVLLFHSILCRDEKEKMNDSWYYDSEKFEELCKYIKNKGYCTCTLESVIK